MSCEPGLELWERGELAAQPMVVGRVYPAHWDHTQQRLVLDENKGDQCVLPTSRSMNPGELAAGDPFPSLSLMQQPARGFTTASLIEPPHEVARPLPEGAPIPRLRLFPGGPGHEPKWRCQVPVMQRQSLEQAKGCLPMGWGNTEVRAWNAWCDSWATYNPKTDE